MTQSKKSELNKSALLEEGMQQLSKNGYHGTGIKKILDVVKIPKGSFYNYFSSKEAYVSEIIDNYNHQAMELFDGFVEQSSLSAIDQLKKIYSLMLEKLVENKCQRGCIVGSIAAEIGNSYELCQLSMVRGVDGWISRITQILEEAQQQGSIRTDLQASDMAEVLWSTWEGALIKMKMDGHIKSPEKTISLMLNQILINPKQ